MLGFQDVDNIVQAFGENMGASTDQILRDYYGSPPQHLFFVNDGVRIISHPDAEDLEGIDPVGTVVEVEYPSDHWGPYKVDIKFLGTWFYCKSEELEELSSSERLFYGV